MVPFGRRFQWTDRGVGDPDRSVRSGNRGDASASTGYSTPVEIGLLVGGAIAIVLAGIGGLVALRGAKRTNQ